MSGETPGTPSKLHDAMLPQHLEDMREVILGVGRTLDPLVQIIGQRLRIGTTRSLEAIGQSRDGQLVSVDHIDSHFDTATLAFHFAVVLVEAPMGLIQNLRHLVSPSFRVREWVDCVADFLVQVALEIAWSRLGKLHHGTHALLGGLCPLAH